MQLIFINKKAQLLARSLLICFFIFPGFSSAQMAEPNAMGSAMGHIHFMAEDISAANQFWTDLGAQEVQWGPLTIHVVPNVRILTIEQKPNHDSIETVVNHLGFTVPDLGDATARWQAAGIHVEEDTNTDSLWVIAPEGARIQIEENPGQAEPLVFQHVHWSVQDVEAVRSWYAEMFGAMPGSSTDYLNAMLPGGNLIFSHSEEELLPTEGNALDHIGIEVVDLRATISHMQANGAIFDTEYDEVPGFVAYVLLKDPWGTRLEITQDLEP